MKRLSGFSLMEMMVVLLIIAVVAAASAPMINKKMVASVDGSPWVWAGGTNIAYNVQSGAMTASIGTSNAPQDADTPRLYLDSRDPVSNPQLAFGKDRNNVAKLRVDNNSLFFSNSQLPPNMAFPNESAIYGMGAFAADNAVAIGRGAGTLAANTIAIGRTSAAGFAGADDGDGAIAIGGVFETNRTQAVKEASIAIGAGSYAGESASIAIGGGFTKSILWGLVNLDKQPAKAEGARAISIGTASNAAASNAVALGYRSRGLGDDSIAIGRKSKSGSDEEGDESSDSIAIGACSEALASNTIAIGSGANAYANGSIAIGSVRRYESSDYQARATEQDALAIGAGAGATGIKAIAIGLLSKAFAERAIAIGDSADVRATNSIAIGTAALVDNVNHTNSVAIGYKAQTTAANQIVLGDSSTTVYIPGHLIVDKASVIGRDELPYIRVWKQGGGYSTLMHIDEGSADLKPGGVWTHSFNQSWYNLSDRRLKNVGKAFVGGLEEIKKLEVFNYTFKKDPTKTLRVGVMAQDLQKIFPNAVFKGDDGFLRIRMEDMFYALVNAVKELDAKIDLLAQKQKKIDELEDKVAKLEKRLEKLEKSLK